MCVPSVLPQYEELTPTSVSAEGNTTQQRTSGGQMYLACYSPNCLILLEFGTPTLIPSQTLNGQVKELARVFLIGPDDKYAVLC